MNMSDGTHTLIETFNVTVTSNHYPKLDKSARMQQFEYPGSGTVGFSADDPDGDELTWRSHLPSDIDHMSISMTDNVLTATPNTSIVRTVGWQDGAIYGTPILTEVSDGQTYDYTVVAACVTGVNLGPEIVAFSDQTVTLAESVAVQVSASDTDGDRIAFVTPLPDDSRIVHTAVSGGGLSYLEHMSVGDVVTSLNVESIVLDGAVMSATLSGRDAYGNTLVYALDAANPILGIPESIIPANDSRWCLDRGNATSIHSAEMRLSGLSVGNTTVALTVVDPWGGSDTKNFTVTVLPTHPVITLHGPANMTIPLNMTYVEPGYNATDYKGVDLTANVTITGTVDVNTIGTYTLRYDVTDSAGNPAITQNRTIRVVDETPPVITLVGLANMTISVNSTYAEPGYAAADDYDSDITGNVTITGTVDATTIGTYTLHYDVTDSSGNPAIQQNRTVNVVAGLVTTWRTTVPDEQITIPAGGGVYSIDWGDGTASSNATGSQTHAYAIPGDHTVRISGDFDRIRLGDDPANAAKLISIDRWGGIQWSTMNEAFAGAANMAYLATDIPDLSSVADASGMFRDAASFNGDVSEWDVSKVTDMGGMFEGASSFDRDVSEWDVSSVTDMSGMFMGAASFNRDISSWNVSSATDMSNMFDGATSFEQNLGPWYVIPDGTTIRYSDAPGTVSHISSQNAFLDGQSPSYMIGTGGDSALFGMANGTTLVMEEAPSHPVLNPHTVNITASGVLGGDGPHHRMIQVEVDVPPNRPPTVQAGPDQAVPEGSTVRLNGTASDPNGYDRLAYLWTHGSTLDITLDDATALSTTFAAPQVHHNTTVTFTLTATDLYNATATDHVNVTIVHINVPPSVQAGPDRTVPEGQTVTLSGMASDPDEHDNLTYLWTHDSALNITLENATSISTAFDAPYVTANATVAFTLTVHDGTESASDSMNVIIIYDNTTAVWTPDRPPGLYGIGRISLANAAPGTIQATWDEPTREPFKYRISWAKVGEPYKGYVDLSGNAFPTTTSHTIVGLEGGHLYKVQVRADYNGYAGPWSGDVVVAVARFVNNPPTVQAGPDQTIPEGQTATLSGTASDPDEHDTLTYLWTHGSTLDITLADATARSTTFEAPQVHHNTTVTFTLTATDLYNATATDQLNVTVVHINAPPSVQAGPDQDVPEGQTATLSGMASDPDEHDTLTYLWTHDAPAHITLDNATSISTAFTAPHVHSDTTFTFTLAATDLHNLTASDAVAVTVTNVDGNPPDTSNTVTLDPPDPRGSRDIGRITLSSSDPGTILVVWEAPDEDPDNYRISWAGVGEPFKTWRDPSGNAYPTEPFHTITDLEGGQAYKVMVRAAYGGTSGDWSGEITVTVAGSTPNRPPTAGAGPDQAVSEGDTVTLSGTASDPDPDDHLTYLWTHDSALDITLANATALSTQFTAPQVASDATVTFTLTATDQHNLTASDTVVVAISDVPPPNRPPTVQAGPDQSVSEGDTVTLSGTASDPDPGDTLTHQWTQSPASPAVAFANDTSPSTTFDAPQVDSTTILTLTLTATDRHGASSSDSMNLTVSDIPAPPPNRPPTAGAGDDQSVSEGDTVTLSGTATDPDSDDLAYLWTHDSALDISLANATALSTTFDAPQVSSNTTVTFTLTVSDGNLTAADTVAVAITDVPPPNRPPTADAGQPQSVSEGDTVTLSGTASDPDNDDLAYLWTHDSPLDIDLADATSLLTTFEAPQVDQNVTVTFTLTATDTHNATASDTVHVTIADVPADPPAAPANLRATSTNSTVTLAWDDPDDATITGYKILSRAPATESELSELDDVVPPGTSHEVTGLEPDTAYVFRIIAINEHGESGVSSFVRLSTLP